MKAKFLLASVLIFLGNQAKGAIDPFDKGLPSPADKKINFGKDIYPILKSRCFRCHQGPGNSAGYRLDLRAEILGETNGHPLVKLGKSSESILIDAVFHRIQGKEMPRKGKRLSIRQIQLLRAWIDQGLIWDNKLLPPTRLTSSHWAFQPIQSPPVPKVKAKDWVKNPIDAFIVAKLKEKGLKPNPPASRRTLIRRLSLDLIGLPPSPKQIKAFLKDKSPQAYQNLVEQKLQSKHHGERWARHWLDIARWAESEGYESNHPRLFAWRYRDYVVRSFNGDKPYDQFIREQIAGDELVPYSDTNLIATGFLAGTRLSTNEEDQPRQRNDMLVDIVNATSSALLGLTMNCAQCHNHKFDPITSRDFYRFQGFFIKGQVANLSLRDAKMNQEYEASKPEEYDALYQKKWELFEKGRRLYQAQVRKKLTPEMVKALVVPLDKRTNEEEKLARLADLKFQATPGRIVRSLESEDRKLYEKLRKKLTQMEKKMKPRPQTFAFYSPITSPHKIDVLPMKGFYPLPLKPTQLDRTYPHLLRGGDVHNRGPRVEVGWPEVFGPSPETNKKLTRVDLAKWLTDPQNPLTARVWVNRLWQYHFGRGIVATPADFGTQGVRPTHAKLLDWLASELIRSGWSTRHIHRLIVTSNTYQQSSAPNAANAKIDPENKLWWRWMPRRLEAEAIRDSMLVISGELDPKIGGPSCMDEKSLRRSLYLFQKRDHPPKMQRTFDGPSAVLESCSRRHVSTVATQALYLLNNDFSFRRAKAFAERVRQKAGDSLERQIDQAFLIALGRNPTQEDRIATHRFFRVNQSADNSHSLVQFCQALMNVNEFVYIE